MYSIPTDIKIGEKTYHIRNDGDYRVILDCFEALSDSELTSKERLLAALIIFYNDINSIYDLENQDVESLVTEMYKFFNCGSDSQGKSSNHRLIDWVQDEQLICSAINKVANLEIRSQPYIHWWTFIGYYTAIGDSPLSTIIQIRDKIFKGKHLEKYEREFRNNNPQYFTKRKTLDELEAEKLVQELWNNGE